MYGPSLDRPAPQYVNPGMDERMRTADEIVDELIMVISADRTLAPDETRAIQRLMAAMQAIAAQRTAADATMAGAQPQETSDFGATEGTEGTENSAPMPGQEYAGQGY